MTTTKSVSTRFVLRLFCYVIVYFDEHRYKPSIQIGWHFLEEEKKSDLYVNNDGMRFLAPTGIRHVKITYQNDNSRLCNRQGMLALPRAIAPYV